MLLPAGCLCDITIKMADRTFQAHRNILAAASGYFRTMFTAEFQERNQEEVVIQGKSDIFDNLLTSVYKGKLTLSHEIVVETLSMAIYMQLNHTFQLFHSYLSRPSQKRHLELNIAFQISNLVSSSYENSWLDEIREVCNIKIRKEWRRFKKMDGFLQDVTTEFLKGVLDHGYFPLEEKEVWFNFDELQFVRFQFGS